MTWSALGIVDTRFHRFAMLLNGLLAACFIVAGSFNGLVVLIGMFEGEHPIWTTCSHD